MRTILAAMALIAAAGVAYGQNLTAGQEARKELGVCYSKCFQQRVDQGITAVEALADLYWEMWLESDSMTQQQWGDFVNYHNGLECVAAQALMSLSASCSQGCRDVEQAYDSTTSSARSVFNYQYRENLNPLRESGLWTQWNNYPKPGSSQFAQACDRWRTAVASGGSTPTTPVEIIPKDRKIKKQ